MSRRFLVASAFLFLSQAANGAGYCYVVADQPGDDNAYLYDFTGWSALNPTASDPVEIALAMDTNTANIEASEFNPVNKTYYAWNANQFGVINTNWDTPNNKPNTASPGTGVFSTTSTETSAICGLQGGTYRCGPSAGVAPNTGTGNNYDIDGMAYNPVSDLWFGSVRIDDGRGLSANPPGRPDWLVVYDNTGNVIEDYFGYNDPPANTQPIGFVEIEAQNNLHDIDDLGFNVVTGQLYGVANVGGSSDTLIVEINTTDGTTTNMGRLKLDNTSASCVSGGDTTDYFLTDVEGVSIDLNGNIFAVTGTNGSNAGTGLSCLSNAIFYLGTVDDLDGTDLDSTLLRGMSETDQESISCLVYEPVTIGDNVFHDLNGNGLPDSGEGIPGVVLKVYNVGTGLLIGSKTTDVNGNYLYEGLVPDAAGYRVEVDPANFLPGGALEGFLQTVDPDATADNQGTSGPMPNEGDQNLGLDFGYRQSASIGDRVWNDLDGDGIQDVGEPGVSGVTVTLYTGAGTQVGLPDTTDGSGNYGFSGLAAGDYYVVFSGLPSGFAFGRANQGSDDTVDSDANPADGRTANTTLAWGENDPTWDAGIYQSASIGDRVWVDANFNGIQDGGESGLQGVTVTLYDSSDSQVGQTTTAPGGNYSFTGLVPGEYYVVFTLPAASAFSPQDAGSDDTADSDANPATGRAATTTLDAGENDTSWDAGVLPVSSLGSLGDRVWDDLDGDGLQDAGEAGVANVTVTLYTGAGVQVGSPTTTDGSGNYGFSGLASGNYYVVFSNLPADYEFSPANQGGDDAADSDADPADGQSVTLSLSLGENNTTLDAGIYKPASLGDRVWDDLDADGVQDAGEAGIPGVTVTLYDSGDNELDSTTTDNNGDYNFTDLNPGDYYVVFSDLPPGFRFSPIDQGGDDTLDSDADPSDGKTGTVTLASGDAADMLDAGLYRTVSLGDKVWFDTNQDGVQDAEEGGVAGVTVNLFDGGNNQIGSTTTDGAGNYSFDGLDPGTYSVGFVLPSGYAFTLQDVTGVGSLDDSFDSDANPANGRTAAATLAAGDVDLTLDAGLYLSSGDEPASLGDRVWYDTNNNGIQDGSEPGVAGLTINLYDGTGTNLLATTGTDGNGNYVFEGLAAGNYSVQFVAPAGYAISPQDQGIDETLDSDASPGTGFTAPVTLSAGDEYLDLDAGMRLPSAAPARLSDRVWYDTNGDGIQEAGELGISGVVVTLFAAGDPLTPVASTITDADGLYGFEGLAPGDYVVGFEAPPGLVISPMDEGSDDALDSDANPGTGLTQVITLGAGDDNMDTDAGMRVPGVAPLTIGDFVWGDLNADGLQDGGEPGIDGVEVVLFNGSGVELARVTTSGGGAYTFVNVLPGDYRVEVDTATLPAGLVQTADPDSVLDAANDLNGLSSSIDTVDFGFSAVASIGDFVWNDLNGDGVQDAGEPGIDGVDVYLDLNNNGVLDNGEPSATTAGGGAYLITGVAPGTYSVRVDSGSLPPGLVPTTGNLPLSVELGPGEAYSDGDFGYQLQNAIVGVVYEDLDGDRSQDAGEGGIEGVTVRLLDINGDEVATTTTTADGSYQFVGLSPGDYTVEELDPSGYVSTTPNTVDLTLPAGEVVIANFGDLPPTTSALVLDAFAYCENNVPYVNYSVTPVGISPDSVTIRWDNVPDYTETLLDQPLSNTALLWPGAAVVDGVGVAWPGWEIVDGAWVPVPDDPRMGPLDFTVIVNPEQTVTLTYPPVTDDCVAGPSQISGRVFEDDDASTTQGTGEPGIPGVTIELLDSEGNVVATTQTDSSGFYSFTGIEPGSYTVREVDPGGYASTTGNEVPVTLGVDRFPVVDFGDQRNAGAPVAIPVLSPLGLIVLMLGMGLLAGHRASHRRFAGKL